MSRRIGDERSTETGPGTIRSLTYFPCALIVSGSIGFLTTLAVLIGISILQFAISLPRLPLVQYHVFKGIGIAVSVLVFAGLVLYRDDLKAIVGLGLSDIAPFGLVVIGYGWYVSIPDGRGAGALVILHVVAAILVILFGLFLFVCIRIFRYWRE